MWVFEDYDDIHPHMSDIPLQRPASAHVSSDTSALVTCPQDVSDHMRNAPSLQPIPSQILGNYRIPLRTLKVYLQCLDLKKRVKLFTQRAREVLHDREAARRALFHKLGHFLAATHHHGAAPRQNLVSTLARIDIAHNYNVQMPVRQLEHEAGAQVSQKQKELLSRFPNQALEDQREFFGHGSDI